MIKLSFSKGNAKLGSHIYTFSLPAGHTCIGAKDCLAKANRETGKLTHGKGAQFQCFAATAENMFPNVRKSRWNNFEALKGLSVAQMVKSIADSMPKKAVYFRIHVSGDFFNLNYFDAWMEIARANPAKQFYCYTKAIPFWIARKDSIPENFVLNASIGSRYDDLITQYNLKCARVVFSESEAANLGLQIDHDDSLALAKNGKSFALLLHGSQQAGTVAAKANYALRKAGKNGYKSDYFAHYSKS
jgi:hypothetical protein